jgi:hypothetical protein
MVVMDLLGESWVPLDINTLVDVGGFKVRFHTVELHQVKMVHGDTPETNAMAKDGGHEFMLIDYGWAGLLAEVRYPRHVNTAPALQRPDDVEDGNFILTEHDLLMFENIFGFLIIAVLHSKNSNRKFGTK